MINRIKVIPMENGHIEELTILWEKQFDVFCCGNAMYNYWKNHSNLLKDYIQSHAENGNGITAWLDNKCVGYLAYETGEFHGAKSAFIPFAGNAAAMEGRESIYLALYKKASECWLDQGIRNQYYTIGAEDIELKNVLFDLGFGSYVVDCFSAQFTECMVTDTGITIEKAGEADAAELFEVVKESRDYYSLAPLFLIMEPYPYEDLVKLIAESNVFIAKDSKKIIGFMNLSISKEDDIISMCLKGFGQIDEIGAYIKDAYRGKQIGNLFIKAIAAYCRLNGIPCVHVDYESSNLYGNKFWRKHFTPALLSLKRTIHADI